MSRILFAWELGGGYGHLGPFRPVAEALLARGHEVTVAARDVQNAAVVFGATPLHVVQAPLCTKTYNGLAEPPLNYAEILMRYGYLDGPQLAGLLRAWRGLLDVTRADVLIADHAPSALLAARGTGVARVVTGTPFAVLPRVNPTPNMRPWVNVPAQRLENSDASVLACINPGLPAGAASLKQLSDIFDGVDYLLTGVPELDPYGPRNPEYFAGLYSGAIGRAVPSWPAGEGPRIFAYLSGEYRHIDAVFAALSASSARCVVFIRDGAAALRQKYHGGRVVFSDHPLDIDRAASESDFCLCHGNFGTVCDILRLGKPMLLLPMDLEKFLLSTAVQNMGTGRLVHPDAPNPDFGGAIRQMVEMPLLGETARAFAQKHREPTVDTIVQRAADRIETLARTQDRPG